MHLVLITQKVDESDDILGFTIHWVRALAARVDRLTCIALQVGDVSQRPDNVELRSLHKESRPHRFQLALALHRELARVCGSERVDAILAHMAPVYAVASYPVAKRHRIPIYLWYTHRAVDWWLRVGTAVSKLVFTASAESFRLPTSKRRIVGHGIPLEHFKPARAGGESLLAVGRTSRVKKLDVLIRAMALVENEELRLSIVGEAATAADTTYRAELDALVAELGLEQRVVFEGSVPHRNVPSFYERAFLTVAPSAQSFDKAVLESMASGRCVLTGNRAFAPLFGRDAEKLLYDADDPRDLASKIDAIVEMSRDERIELGESLRIAVANEHSLERLAEKVVDAIRKDRES